MAVTSKQGVVDGGLIRSARFARVVFTIAGIWGILIMTPLYFTLDAVNRAYPPPITHPDLYYGFIDVTLAWQIAFLIIASNPVRYRTIMLAGILEKVSDHAGVTKNPDELSEYARRSLGSQIVKPFQAENGRLQAITLDPRLEQQIAQGVRQTPTDVSLTMEPKLARHVVDTMSQRVQQLLSAGQQPIIMCAPQIRLAFRRFFESTFADLTVLSYAEIPSRVEIQNAGIIPCPE